MTQKVADLRHQRAAAFDAFKALADKPTLSADERTDYDAKKRAVQDLDDQITRSLEAQAMSVATAQPVEGQDASVAASVETDPYVSNDAAKSLARNRGLMEGSARSLVIGGMVRMCAASGGNILLAQQQAAKMYGEGHPVTRALGVSTGSGGGFLVPPDYMNEVIELLRPTSVVRSAGPRVIPMPRGTMTLPGQNSPATAAYGTEFSAIVASQQTVKQKVASFKKLTALVPVSNDMMRYAEPAVDAFVRDDLVQVIALREDLAFLLGDGTSGAPMGFTGIANEWVINQGGTAGAWSSTANSVAAVNGTPGSTLTGQNGGSFITSTESYTEATIVAELTGMIQKLDSANVPDNKRIWFFNPRTYNYLFGLLNSLGLYVFRDELSRGTLYGYPFKKSNQIPTNIWDTTGANKDCSFILLAEMTEAMIFDSMQLELAVSREGTYVDASGNTVSAFQADQTLIRAIEEHDFLLRHDSAVAIDQFVRWAPALS